MEMERTEIVGKTVQKSQKNNRFDSREKTSDVIYEFYCHKKQVGVTCSRIIFCISIFMAIIGITLIGIIQYHEYYLVVVEGVSHNTIEDSKKFCNDSTVGNIEYVTTSIATTLIFFYILLYKRRVAMRNKFEFRNIGLPMITSLWNKSDRFFHCFTYGLIAFNVFSVIISEAPINSKNDPTGILYILYQLVTVLVVGARYYPILVGKRLSIYYLKN